MASICVCIYPGELDVLASDVVYSSSWYHYFSYYSFMAKDSIEATYIRTTNHIFFLICFHLQMNVSLSKSVNAAPSKNSTSPRIEPRHTAFQPHLKEQTDRKPKKSSVSHHLIKERPTIQPPQWVAKIRSRSARCSSPSFPKKSQVCMQTCLGLTLLLAPWAEKKRRARTEMDKIATATATWPHA
jgi:hypothetical protein